MATASPLSAGLKTKGILEGEAGEEYSKYLAELKASLDARKNRMFDPSMLAMAAGFLSPTQTGGFGESLANAMKGYTQSQAVEEKQDVENAAMRLQIAQAENEQRMRRDALQGLTGQTLNAPQAGGEGAKPSGVPTFRGMPVTPELVARMKIINPELGAALETQLKLTYEGVTTQPGGIVEKATKTYTPFGGKVMVDRFIPGDAATGQPAMTLKMTEQDAITFDNARASGDAETFYKIIDRYTKPLQRPSATAPATSTAPTAPVAGAPTAPAGQPAPTTVAKPSGSFATTPGSYEREQEVTTARLKAEAEAEAQAAVKRTQSFKDQGVAALQVLPVIDQAQALLKMPNIGEVLAVLEGPTVKQNLGALFEEAFRVGNYTVGIPAIRKVLTNANTDQKLIDAAALLAQTRAVMNFQMRQGLGSGTSVSNFEQQMVNAMGPEERDTPETYNKKLKFLKRQAEFRRDLAIALENSGMQFDRFQSQPKFTEMFDEYRKDAEAIVMPKGASKGAGVTGTITKDDLKRRLKEGK